MRRSAVLWLVLAVLAITYWDYAQYVIACIVSCYVLRAFLRIYRFIRRFITNHQLKSVDEMDGLEFEEYVADMLKRQGYSDVMLTVKYDYGVDIIATKDGIRWGVQVKHYSGLDGANAVQQVVTGLRMYDCDCAMVVTNSMFSHVAVELADANNCELFDRSRLVRIFQTT